MEIVTSPSQLLHGGLHPIFPGVARPAPRRCSRDTSIFSRPDRPPVPSNVIAPNATTSAWLHSNLRERRRGLNSRIICA
jgi:hypothetical protein